MEWGRDLEDIDSDKLNKLLDGKARYLGKRAQAAGILQEVLEEVLVTAKNIEHLAKEAGIGMNTFEAAKKDIGIRSVRRDNVSGGNYQ